VETTGAYEEDSPVCGPVPDHVEEARKRAESGKSLRILRKKETSAVVKRISQGTASAPDLFRPIPRQFITIRIRIYRYFEKVLGV